ncbi:MAG: GNAT family N-acetyltransferase [Gaiellaceae bacterium]
MSSIEVRPFHRNDREQLAALVKAHAAAVVPGLTVSVNAVLSQLEREAGEFIVDPWVSERTTLVAEQRQRIVAAAHLLRFASDKRVSESYRDAGEMRWFLFWPEAPYWPDSAEAADALIAACIDQLGRWGVARQYADGTLPAPGVYGVPEQWPHIRMIYERSGFVHDGHTEIVYIANVDRLRGAPEPPVAGLSVRRSVGINGTRLSALLDGDEVAGYIEVETLQDAGRMPQHAAWADIGNLYIADKHRRHGIATWLIAQAGEWLQLARVELVLGYTWPEQKDCNALLERVGFRELTRTERGWVRTPLQPR